MVRLNNDSQNLALQQAATAASRVASRQAHNTQRSSAAAARSRVTSTRYASPVSEATQTNTTATNELGGAAAQQSSPATDSLLRGELNDTISENLDAAKAMKKYYEVKIDSLTSDGEPSSDYERAMLENYRNELSLYQSASDFWSIERKTSYQYAEEDLAQAAVLYDQIISLQSSYDPTGTSIFQLADKTLELYTLK